MSTLLNFLPPITKKPERNHPWEGRVKGINAKNMKYAHNSISSNPHYPKNNKKTENKDTKHKFVVIGSRFTKEFIYCKHIVRKLYKYKSKVYDKPVVRGVTTVQWPNILNELKLKYGGLIYCMNHPVVVMLNNSFLGGYEELMKYFKEKYLYSYHPDENIEIVKEFTSFVSSSNRPFVYMDFSIDGKHAGTMIFMLYSDIVPETCTNFIRLCSQSKGGYPGTPVHRIVKDCWIQSGGFGLKSTDMRCENFIVDFDKRGVLGMANAERHVDCSTQFFIISQPAQWMKHNYVAFGQLVDGDSTFRRIEEVPTWYECPTQDIKIESSGILNLECHYTPVNKNAGTFIDCHIENLYEVGEMCIEMLLKRVFDDILIKYLNTLEEDLEEETPAILTNEDNVTPVSSSTSLNPLDSENKEFDTEEEYHYKHTANSDIHKESESTFNKPNVPFYIPLTDVPYPGEDDSIFDLKKFLTGKYCLETDLGEGLKRSVEPLQGSATSFLPVIDNCPSSSSSGSSQLDAQNKSSIDAMISAYGERISFAGTNIKQLAKSRRNKNMDYNTLNRTIDDEQMRKSKQMAALISRRRSRQVSLSVPEDHVDKKVRRKPTGFIRNDDINDLITRLSFTEVNETGVGDDNESDDDDVLMMGARRIQIDRGVIIQDKQVKPKNSNQKSSYIKRRSTIQRLWDEVDIDDKLDPPTFKDYGKESKRPGLQVPGKKQNLLTPSQKIEGFVDSGDRIHRSFSPHIPNDLEKPSQKTIATIKSTEIFNYQRRRSEFLKPTITSTEFSKTRPVISISAYKHKNRQSLATNFTDDGNVKYKGIRLPGDSPLYSASGIHLLNERTFEGNSTMLKGRSDYCSSQTAIKSNKSGFKEELQIIPQLNGIVKVCI